MTLPRSDKKFTYGDYVDWKDDERWEIFDGVPYMQSAPSWQHQAVSAELVSQFIVALRNSSCRVFAAPFDLCIPEGHETDDEISGVVAQPDILIICDRSKLRKTGFFGVPELIIEISSPSTARRDKLIKFNHYEKAGVREYWIVEPENRLISVFTLQENRKYGRPEVYTEEDSINVKLAHGLEGFPIDLKPVFDGIS